MNIGEFRKQYPQYNDLSDVQLADKLYSAHYSDMDKGDFYSKFGVKAQNSQAPQKTSISQDIMTKVKGAPAAFGSFITSLPSEISGAAKQLSSVAQTQNPLLGVGQASQQTSGDATRALGVMAGGALNTAENVANLPATMSGYLQSKGYGKAPETGNPSMNALLGLPKSNIDFQKALGVKGQRPGDTLLSSAAMFLAPETMDTKGLSTFQKAAARAGEGSAYGAATGNDPITGAVLGPTAGKLGETIMGLPSGLTKRLPAKLLRGTATPEELSRNLQAAGDLPINIGKITQSPIANTIYENTIAETPFSGADKAYKIVSEGVQKSGEDLLSSIAGKNANVDPNIALKGALLTAKKNATDIKNNLYNEVDDMAQKEGHQLTLPNTSRVANEASDLLGNSPLLQADSSVKSFINKIQGLKNPVAQRQSSILDASGKQISEDVYPSIKEANLVKNKLYNTGQQISSNPLSSGLDKQIGYKYKELASSIGQDIQDSISSKGSPELLNKYNEATQNYRKNYGPFIDRDLSKFLSADKSADSIAHDIVNPSKTKDKSSNIRKIQSLLPEEQKNSLAHAYLSGAVNSDNTVDVNRLARLSKSLGPRQFNELFKDNELKSNVKNFQNLKDMSSDALSMMDNPKTGKRAVQGILGLNALYLAGHAFGGPIGGGATVATVLGGTRGLNKYLTNPTVRKSLVESMLDAAKGEKPSYEKSMLSKSLYKGARAVPLIEEQKKKESK